MKRKKFFLPLGIGLLFVAMFLVLGGKLQQKGVKDNIYEFTKNKPDAAVTIGIFEDGKMEYHVYGENGKELPKIEHTYAIGSITKTFTGSLLAKEVDERKISMDNQLDQYLSKKSLNDKLTLKSLVTHTSGLSTQWEDALEKNANASFTREQMVELLAAQKLENRIYDPCYSNFGAALAGTVAAEVYGGSYKDVMENFIKQDLGLKYTKVGGTGDLDYYWPWQNNDEMMGSGAILSTVTDMLTYGKMHLEENPSYLSISHQPLAQFTEGYDCGFFWMIDTKNRIIWHNGEVEMEDEDGNPVGFQSFLGISEDKRKVVVVLSNVVAYDNNDTGYADLIGYQMLFQ